MGASYILEYMKIKGHRSIIYDLNNKIYQNITPEFKKDWTINKKYIEKDFFDFCFQNFNNYFQELLDIIEKEKIKFIGFTVLKSNRLFSFYTVQFIKKFFKDIKIIWGGPEVFTINLENFKNLENIDFFVIGEGERAIIEIVENNFNNRIFKFYQLDNINFFPKYENLNLSSYPGKRRIPILSSRGCINKCLFCSERLLYKNYRIRDPENVFEEIYYHYKNNNIQWFTFYDSIFNGDLNNIDKLMDLILKNKLEIKWDAQIYIKDMDLELMKKMKKSGCINLFIGFENGSDKILKLMNKNFTSNDAYCFFYKLNKAQLNFEISLIINYPEETEEDFKQTTDFLLNNKNIIRKIAQINTFKNYPGTCVKIPDNYDEKQGQIRVNKLIRILKRNKIKFTNSYINNLI